MVRKTFYITQEQARRLKALPLRTGKSESAMVRECLERALRRDESAGSRPRT